MRQHGISQYGGHLVNSQLRKPTNLSLDASLLAEAKALKVNLSRAAEDGVRSAVSHAKAAQWKSENTSALKSSNDYVEEHGLPLETYRQF
jgi:antitoxin CcdA